MQFVAVAFYDLDFGDHFVCFFKTFKSVTICAAVISIGCALTGVLISLAAKTPVGSTVVMADAVVFGIFTIVGKILKKN